ncbi:MAG: SpoIIE family protein phosphatase [Thermoleophilia bacterium]
MKIRTTFLISVAVFAIVLGIIATSLIVTNGRVGRVGDQIIKSIDIERSNSELSYITGDYLLHPEQGKRDQWYAKWNQVNDDLATINTTTPEGQAIVDNLKIAHERFRAVFDGVSPPAASDGSSPAGELVTPNFQTSWSRLEVQNQSVTSDAERLTLHLGEQRESLREANNLLIYFLLGGFIAYYIIIYLIVQKRLLSTVAELHSGTETIGSGDLDYKVPIRHDDEIGELAGAFNRMTTDLKNITASKAALEFEIAEREEAQAALRESESSYRSLFENMIEGFAHLKAILDDSGQPANYVFLEVNEAFEEVTGLKSAEVIGKMATEVLPLIGEDPVAWQSNYGKIALDGESERFESYLATLDKWLSIAAYSPARGYFVAVIDDITDRKKAEAELIKKQATIQNYADRLSLLHDIGLSLNRETDKEKLLQTTTAGAAQLTSAGVAAMILIGKGMVSLRAGFSAPWYTESWGECSLLLKETRLHKYFEKLLENSDRISLHVDELSELHETLGLSEPHPELMYMLVNAIRDTRGNLRGMLILSHKAGQAEFTSSDEEIIGLLAGQSSVALTSVENFDREHKVASTLQDSLLPEVPIHEGLDIGIIYQSASGIARLGGDFYDFIDLGEGRLAIAIGDVCGKGLEAATGNAMVKYMLRAYLEDGLSPGQCLRKLNRVLHKQLDMEKFITLQVGIYDGGSGRLEYATAGHPEPVLIVGGNVTAMEMHASLPLGVIEDFEFVSSETRVAAGSCLLMYTDGLLEARPHGGETFGRIRIEKALLESYGGTSQDIIDHLVGQARMHSEGFLKDDIALLMIKRETD